MKLKPSLQPLLLFLILILIAALFTKNFELFIASSFVDDSPVLHAYFFQNPGRFTGDMYSTWANTALVSLESLIPGLLLVTAGIPPETTVLLLVYLQNILLGFALMYFTYTVTERRDIAWMTVLFSFAAYPWQWNLANAVSALNAPYEGQMVLPFLVFAATAAIKLHVFRVAALLAFSGLIHPPFAIYMIMFVGLFWILHYGLKDWQSLSIRVFSLAGAAIVCYFPSWLLVFNNSDRVSSAELMEMIRRNYHFVPWLFNLWWSQYLPTFLGFMGLTGLSLIKRKKVTGLFMSFWYSALIGTILFSMLHVIGIWTRIPLFVQLLGLRATSLLVILSLPLVMFYLMEKLNSDQFMIRWMAATVIVLQAYFSWGVFWGCTLALLLWDLSTEQWGKGWLFQERKSSQIIRQGSKLIFSVWIILVILLLMGMLSMSKILLTITIPGMQDVLTPNSLIVLLSLAGLLAWICRPEEKFLGSIGRRFNYLKIKFTRLLPVLEHNSLNVIPFMIVLIGISLLSAWKIGTFLDTSFSKALYDAQLWAKKNTSEDAIFITAAPWRVLSLRRKVNPIFEGMAIYSGSRTARQYDEELLRFYELEESTRGKLHPEIFDATISALRMLNESGILKFACQFGGDYIVRNIDRPLAFPEVYRNNQLVIYKIPKNN